jgi:hypothetical protein
MPTAEPVVAVASGPRRDVHVHVKDILAGGRAVVDEDIVAIWTQCLYQSSRPAVRFASHLRSDFGIELMPQRDVHLRDHEQVPARGLITIEDDEAVVALLEECAREVSSYDAAQHTGHWRTECSSAARLIGTASVMICGVAVTRLTLDDFLRRFNRRLRQARAVSLMSVGMKREQIAKTIGYTPESLRHDALAAMLDQHRRAGHVLPGHCGLHDRIDARGDRGAR